MVDIAAAEPSSARVLAKPQRTPRRAAPVQVQVPGPRAALERPPTLEPRAAIEDWLRIPEEKRAELIRGRIVYHACPSVSHGNTQGRLSRLLFPYDRRRTGGGSGGAAELGGWWLSQEVDLVIGDVGCRPDIVAWRRDKHARVPQPDARGAVSETPDFLCEVLSPSTARYDQGEKRDAYFHAGVPYYWLVDTTLQTLTVLERTDRGYLIVLVAGPGERVRAAPFAGVEISVDELFMDEEGERPAVESAKPPATASTEAAGAEAVGAAPGQVEQETAKGAAGSKKRAPRRR